MRDKRRPKYNRFFAFDFDYAMNKYDISPKPCREVSKSRELRRAKEWPDIGQDGFTIASRKGRGIEGFSQGGRGTTRIMFRHPELFCSAAPGGGGFATEKKISEKSGCVLEKI